VSIRLAVALGGALGALARVIVDAALPVSMLGGFPISTLLVNLTGAFALAVLMARVHDPLVRAGVGTGMLGAWTTFSALAVQTVALIEVAPVRSVAYIAATLIGGVLAVRLGARGARGAPATEAGAR
jgi:CrcB protein